MNSERFVLVKGCAGLGNRLLAIAAALDYAAATRRNVIVDWRDGAYGAHGVDAFTKVFRLAGAASLDALRSPKICSLYPASWPREFLDRAIFPLFKPVNAPFGMLPDWLLPRGKFRLLKHLWQFTGEDSPNSMPGRIRFGRRQYLRAALDRRSFPFGSDLACDLKEDVVIFGDFVPRCSPAKLREKLSLSDEMQTQLEKILAPVFKNPAVQPRRIAGVHVRATDMKPRNEVARLPEFLKQRLAADELLYLATDNPGVVELFRQHFGKRLLRQEIAFPDDVSLGIHRAVGVSDAGREQSLREAVADLWALSRAERLFYQGNSSFSRLAAAFRKPAAEARDWEKCLT